MYTQFDYNKMWATGVTIKNGYLNQDGTFTSSGYDAVMEDLLNNLNKSGKAYKDFKNSLGGDTSNKKLQNEILEINLPTEFMDDVAEVGMYTIQIRLFNEDQTSVATLPEIIQALEIREPIAIEE